VDDLVQVEVLQCAGDVPGKGEGGGEVGAAGNGVFEAAAVEGLAQRALVAVLLQVGAGGGVGAWAWVLGLKVRD